MAEVCDFIQIIGDNGRNVSGPTEDLPNFNTGSRMRSPTALLIYSVKDLQGSADVYINGSRVGAMTETSGSIFSTQLIAVSGAQLRDGDNTIQVRNISDPFFIKDLICFFHQSPVIVG